MTVFCSHWDGSAEDCVLELSVSKALKMNRKAFPIAIFLLAWICILLCRLGKKTQTKTHRA